MPTGGHGHMICMGNHKGGFSQENSPEGCTETQTSSFSAYKQVSRRNDDHEWPRMINAFILCYLVWKVQKSHAANREVSFNRIFMYIKYIHFCILIKKNWTPYRLLQHMGAPIWVLANSGCPLLQTIQPPPPAIISQCSLKSGWWWWNNNDHSYFWFLIVTHYLWISEKCSLLKHISWLKHWLGVLYRINGKGALFCTCSI